MRFLLKTFVVLLLLVLAGGVAALVLMLEDQPIVPGGELVAADLQNARVFIENSDPRRLQSGELSSFTISDEDLELLLNYLLDHFAGGRSRVDIAEGAADLRLSVRQPLTFPLGDYLNLRIVLLQQDETLVLDSLRAGRILVPGWLADPLMQRTHVELRKRVPEYAATVAAIDSFTLADERLNIIYEWQPELLDRLSTRGSDLLLGTEDRERLLAHWARLDEVLSAPDLDRRVALAHLMAPMFAYALERQGDAVEENRAVLRVLSLYVAQADVAQLLGEDLPAPPRHTVILAGREDRAQHFLISAGLTVSASTVLAESLGLLKEVDDSQGGSGFSFIDIGADRTGVRFAELAIAGPEQARWVQQRMASIEDESLFMADFRDLPELLSEEAFRESYGGVGEPAYEAVLQDIDERIGDMPLFR
jgi:hypothetical protein